MNSTQLTYLQEWRMKAWIMESGYTFLRYSWLLPNWRLEVLDNLSCWENASDNLSRRKSLHPSQIPSSSPRSPSSSFQLAGEGHTWKTDLSFVLPYACKGINPGRELKVHVFLLGSMITNIKISSHIRQLLKSALEMTICDSPTDYFMSAQEFQTCSPKSAKVDFKKKVISISYTSCKISGRTLPYIFQKVRIAF